MKKIFLKVTVALTLCVLAGSGQARAQEYRQPIHIPFDFTVNNRLIEAGDYSMERVAHDVLMIRDRAGRPVTSILTIPTTRKRIPEKSELLFNRYGSDYFLSKAFWAGNSSGQELPKSKPELQLASKQKPRVTMSLVRK